MLRSDSVTLPRTRTRRAVSVLGAAFLAAGVLAGCGSESSDSAGTTPEGYDLVEDGKLSVCTHLPYRPFQFRQGGKVVGFDVDLMNLVAKDIGVEQKIVDTPFEGIKSGADLKTGKCDIAAAAMTITPEREKVIDFSVPYFDANQSLLVKKGTELDSLDALQGKKLGVQSGTTGADYAKENAPGSVTQVTFEDLGTQVAALESGQVDAVINDFPVMADAAQKSDGLEVSTQFETGEQYGFGMKKGRDDKLPATVDRVLKKAMKDGTYDRIYKKWFGTAPPK
jgi:polar amino acid transport system substrate-binding protein